MSFRTALLSSVILLLSIFIHGPSIANDIAIPNVAVPEAQRETIGTPSSSRRQTDQVSNSNSNSNSNTDTDVDVDVELADRIVASPKTPILDIAATEQKVRRVLTALACLGVVCLATVFAAKLYRFDVAPGKANQLRLISTMKIAPRCCVTLVCADGQKFLIARDAGGVKSVVPLQRDFDDFVSNNEQATSPLDNQLLQEL